MKTVIFIVAGLLVLAGVIAGAVAFLGADAATTLQRTEVKAASAAVMQAVSYNQEIVERVGSPVAMGEASVQREDLSSFGPSTMSLNLAISGPQGGGRVSANLTRAEKNQPWRVTNGSFFPTAGPPIFLRGR
ncbi:MAG: hypothetical protein HY901_36145 [Deltaproteobacteria bacterium]|nr:hypothetical protein [Deltaproteobacteria bacterium]